MTEKRERKNQGLVYGLTQAFAELAQKYLPDAYILALLLTVIVFLCGILFAGQTPFNMLLHFNEGMWSLLSFSMQSVTMVVFSTICVGTGPVKKAMKALAGMPKTPAQAIMLGCIMELILFPINSTFALVFGAVYAKEVGKNTGKVDYLSEKLTAEFGKGFDESNLRKMRKFYVAFPIQDTLCPELSWSHYRMLMRVTDKAERDFYLEEAARSGWSVRQLDRQINTFYYKRILASRDKESVADEIETAEPRPEYEKIIKDPYVLEFLDLPPNEHFYESNLEQALIDHLQKFLLELGRGYSFVARQKHFRVDDEDFYIDLVFYNYIMKCFVLIDLKLGRLTHQALGQMQMYVNYYTRKMMNEGDNPPVGLLLCAERVTRWSNTRCRRTTIKSLRLNIFHTFLRRKN